MPEDDVDDDGVDVDDGVCTFGNCCASHSRKGSPSATATPTPAEGSICSFMRLHIRAVALKMSASATGRIRST